MAVSLEARVPLLDHALVEFAVGLPSGLKLRDGTGKWLLRQAAAEVLPAEVLSKPKQGFALPLAAWFRGPLRHRIDGLLRPDARVLEFADPQAIARLHAEHVTERRDHSGTLWRLLAFELWLEAAGGTRAGSPPDARELGVLAAR
jgi:asparagine synthase (glutamine-hydrolysing)